MCPYLVMLWEMYINGNDGSPRNRYRMVGLFCTMILASDSSRVRSSTACSSRDIFNAASSVICHLAVNALAIWRISMASKGFFRISKRSPNSRRSSMSSQE
ncbi:hypothetical protein D3C87_1420300 [compost metagenome]